MAQKSRSTFGKYTLLRKLASGGMGEIFLAKQQGPSGFEKLLVIKRILSHHLDKKDYLDMFFSEAKLVARLNHHNIIQIHEMGEIDGDHYIAMEYVRGKSLRDMIDELRAEGGSLPMAHVVDLGIKLCEGLGYAHQARDIRGRPMNIVHRDINPHNILISYTGDLKLIDFGIAKSEMTSVNTATGTIKGKFVYMSPEQSAADPIDRRSDIFSLGIVLYEMMALENPFVRQNVVLSLEAIQRQEVSAPSSKRSDASPLDPILIKALQKKPEDRYQTAIEMRDDLRNLFRTGAVKPAEQDLSGFLHHLFSADIAEEDRQLAEADQAVLAAPQRAQPVVSAAAATHDDRTEELLHDNSDQSTGNHAAAFEDEEPTVAGDPGDFAQRSLERSEQLVPAPPAMSGQVVTLIPPEDVAPGTGAELVAEAPTKSDRVPQVAAVGAGSAVAQPQVISHPGSTAPSAQAAFSEPIPARLVDTGMAPTREINGSRTSSPQVKPLTSYITDEDSGSLAPAPTPLKSAMRFAMYALLLVGTGLVGFLITNFISDSVRGGNQEVPPGAIVPIESESAGKTEDPNAPLEPPPSIPDPANAALAVPDPVEPTQPKEPEPKKAVVAEEDGDDEVKKPRKGRKRRKGRKGRKRRGRKRKGSKVAAVEPAPAPEPAPEPEPKRPVTPPEPAAPKTTTIKKVEPVQPAPPKPTLLGTITVRASSLVQVVANGRGVGSAPSTVAVRKNSGRLVLSGGRDIDYAVTLEYTVTGSGLRVRVKSSPWAIVKHNGLSLGRTPQGPVSAGRTHRFSLLRPGQSTPFVVTLI